MDKAEFNRREVVGAPLVDAMHIRLPRRLHVFIKTLALMEGTDPSKVARRLLTIAAVETEGYDVDG